MGSGEGEDGLEALAREWENDARRVVSTPYGDGKRDGIRRCIDALRARLGGTVQPEAPFRWIAEAHWGDERGWIRAGEIFHTEAEARGSLEKHARGADGWRIAPLNIGTYRAVQPEDGNDG